MINPLKFKIGDNEITIYTRRVFTYIGIVLLALVLVSFIALEIIRMQMGVEESSGMYSWFIFSFTLLPCFILLYVGSEKIIVSGQDATIYKQHFAFKKPIARFSEIKEVGYVSGSEMGYKAFLKSDPYGKGIALTSSTTNAKHLDDFENEALPLIQQMILAKNGEPAKTVRAVPVIEHYQYYTQKGDVFSLKRKGEVGWSLFLIVVGLLLFYFGFKNMSGGDSNYLFVGAIMMTGIGLVMVNKQKVFNKETQTVTLSYWSVYRKVYSFADFANFRIVRNTTNGVYSGTEVHLVFKKDKFKAEEFTLIGIKNTKKLDLLLKETKSIMGVEEEIEIN